MKIVIDLFLSAGSLCRLREDIALIGPVEKIRDDLDMWKESMTTTLLLMSTDLSMMRTMAEMVL